MGKKSSHKNLRKLAAELPEITVYRKVGSIIKREEAVERGLKLPDKIPSNSDVLRMVESVPGPVNHYRNMKRILEKDGSEGVMVYVRQVRIFDEQRKLKAMVAGQAELDLGEQQFVTEAQSELDAIDATTNQSAPTFDEGEE